MRRLSAFVGLSLTVFALCALFALPGTASAAKDEFCWRRTYGRGAGTVPTACGADQEKDGALCYPKCPGGYKGVGPVCWATCPAGFTDSGVACTKPAAYGRGAGYPWKIGDDVGSLDEARARCRKAHAQGCEKVGQIIYPRCKAGFKAFGSNVCTPECPGGYKDTGATCLKPTSTRGAGSPLACASDKERDAGLCYTPCKTNYSGVGPVCWQDCTHGYPEACGAGCTIKQKVTRPAGANSRGPAYGRGNENKDACTKVVGDQVGTVLNVALNIVSLAAGSPKEVLAEMAKDAVVEGATKASISLVLDRRDPQKKLNQKTRDALASMAVGETVSYADLDPTGIAAVVEAYDYSKCPE